MNDVIVKKVREGRGNVLIEWQEKGAVKRGWIPDALINGDSQVSQRTLSSALPYGFPIEHVLKDIKIEARQLSQALHKRGVWTEEDFKKNPEAIQRALLEVAGQSVSRIQSLVREAKFDEPAQAEPDKNVKGEDNAQQSS